MQSLPVKLFEYMGAGLPIIASDFPFWRKTLEGIDCAIFVNPRNPKEIANAIEFLLANPSTAETMGLNGQSAVLARFNWDSEARKLVDLYSNLVPSPCVA